MFVDLRRAMPERPLEADLCIVGAGPAGISIAKQFIQTKIRVCLVESGDLIPRAENQDLADGEMVSHPHHPLKTSRDRQFGGSTNSWAGSCAPMSAADFGARPWVDLDGWPYSREALDPHYRRAQDLFEIGPYAYDVQDWRDEELAFLDLDQNRLETRLWQLSPRTNFGKTHQDSFREAPNITVLLNATVKEILSDETSTVAEHVVVGSLDGHEVTIRANLFVLACGGIDNARLLLLSRQRHPNGLGNHHDMVGRHFMQHPHVSAASLHFKGAKRWVKNYKDVERGKIWLRARIGLSIAAQERHRALNPAAHIINRYIADSLTHAQSIGYATLKQILLDLRHQRMPRNAFVEMGKIIKDFKGIAFGVLQHLRDQTGALYIMSEQFPNPESRITLSADLDPLGLPKACIDWRLLPVDKHSILVLVSEIQREFERLGIGKVVPDDWLTMDDHTWPISLAGGHHHMGATRMSDTPKDGVVDRDARVHGMKNLYVAGSSIFPTVGCANPTLTLVATSLRLADHLKFKLAEQKESLAVA